MKPKVSLGTNTHKCREIDPSNCTYSARRLFLKTNPLCFLTQRSTNLHLCGAINKGLLFCEGIGDPGAGASTVRLAPLERASSFAVNRKRAPCQVSMWHANFSTLEWNPNARRSLSARTLFDQLCPLLCSFTFSLIGRLNTSGPSFAFLHPSSH